MQASYTDLIIIVGPVHSYGSCVCLTDPMYHAPQNKSEHVDERKLDRLLDHINDLNDLTPRVRAEGRNGVDPALIFGLDSKLFLEKDKFPDASHHDEVETVTIYRGPNRHFGHSHGDHEGHSCGSSCNDDRSSQHAEVDSLPHVLEETLTQALTTLPKESIWRVKGLVKTENGPHILNWAFQRFDLTPVETLDVLADGELLKLTVMGERGEVKRIARRRLAEALGAMMH